jgi:two-component system nitrate/nitrite response regulator NarL
MAEGSAGPVRIVIVDDHAVVREGLRMLIEAGGSMKVVGEAGNRAEALNLTARERPDLVLLDLDLGEESGLDFLPAILKASQETRVLVLTGLRDSETHLRAIRLGAMGVLTKENAAKVLVKAIEKVCTGEIWLQRATTAALLGQMRDANRPEQQDRETAKIASLTDKEREVVALVADGSSTGQIADRLFISEKTVRNHLASIYAKLEVRSRLELALYAGKHGLLRASR